ncbi:hypothetical protein [Actinoplanes sp. NPDC049599]|uniref:hypothetical protein n=1 Tax=Actinoplanes sp. NPDC049599 TaxID=3363903 RepID=UPI003789DEF5
MRRHIQHGPRRRWFAPWKKVCTCGLGASPCYAVRMLADQVRMQPRPTVERARPGTAGRARPSWSGPTSQIAVLRPDRPLQGPELPLLTRGQAARSPRPAR